MAKSGSRRHRSPEQRCGGISQPAFVATRFLLIGQRAWAACRGTDVRSGRDWPDDSRSRCEDGRRKDHPYCAYDKFDFDVPTRTENDVYARYEVRMEEMRQSLRIVQQALDGMPSGPWLADAPHVILPQREKMKTQMESLIYHFKIVTEGFRVPEGSVYQVVESPRGELAYFVVSDGTAKPHRVFMRTPSFGNLQALGALLEGVPIADSIAIMGSMDFVLGDVDR